MPRTGKLGRWAAQCARVAAPLAVLAASILILAAGPGPAPAGEAASHREAPLIAMDPEADITDFFMFRSYEPGKDDKVVLIMDVIPGEEPSSGPNYYHFDPNVLYSFHVDNDADGKAEDVRFDVQFTTEPIRGNCGQFDLFLSYVGKAGSALSPVTALDGAGSEGLCLRQHYSVSLVRKGQRQTFTSDQAGKTLFAVPSNVGPRTMPSYDALAAQGVYTLSNGIRVFAGQRDDPFYIDLGAVFDTLNLRSPGVDMLSGFNVHTIALEVPATMLTVDGKGAGAGPAATGQPKLGAYASTSRRQETVLLDPSQVQQEDNRQDSGPWVQVQRLANPLVNEAIIATEDKDRWNSLAPEQERQFEGYYTNLRLDTALQVVFGAPATPLLDVRDLLLKYQADGKPCSKSRCSELLRLDLSVAPRALAAQQPLTVLGGDGAGWPNGRRPIDDVTDIAVRVIGGTNYASAGDNVSGNDKLLPETFPFIASPWDGVNRVHKNAP